MDKIRVGVKYYDDEARRFFTGVCGLPDYRHEGDAGFDLHVILDVEDRQTGKTIYPGERLIFESGICLGMPAGYWGRIVHRSSTEKRHRLRVIEGTIDNGYIGKLRTQIVNDNSFPVKVEHGERLSQLIFMPLIQAHFSIVETLAMTDRGDNGFGSTGYNPKSHG